MRKRLHIKVSKGCNNNCIFCLDDRKKRTDATSQEVEFLLREHAHLAQMLFTCGEPTIHPLLPKFILMAKMQGYKSIGLVTNGRMLSYKKYCERILSCGVTEITVSIHDSSSKMHERFTRTRGSFNQTVQGLKNLKALKDKFRIKIITSTVITRGNMNHIREILEFLDGFKVDTFVLNVVEPSGEALKNFNRLTPTYTNVSRAIEIAIKGFKSREKVVVEGLPLCLCRGFLSCTGIREEIHLLEGSSLRVLPLDRNHIKPQQCTNCKLSPLCHGIFEEYANKRGTKEIVPFEQIPALKTNQS